jgi:CubicO group peptidase (beta-lactamase class C family)
MTSTRRQFLHHLGLGAAGFGLVGFLPGCGSTPGVTRAGLPRSTPEAQGVSSGSLLAFLDAVRESRHEFHSLMVARHGHVIAEGWWAPYGPEYNHTMYSMSKSFTSTAVGFAVTEGRLKVTDRVISFFPNDLPEQPSEHLKNLRVKDLLTMSVGSGRDTTGAMVASENWVKTFLALPIVNPPGSTFLYNSGATYMLSAIVQQLTGQRVLDYLKPRLFEPLGVSAMTWETCPRGINTGGWGLGIKTEGLARFGQLLLQKGHWQGRQVIPATWVDEATTFKIQQPAPAKPQRPNEQNDWLQGYGYQFWRCQHGGFRGDGAFGQFTVVLPEQEAVIAITSETSNMQGELDLVWQHLLPALKNGPLPSDAGTQQRLRTTLAGLALPPVAGQTVSPARLRVSGRTYQLERNDLGIQNVTLSFENSACAFTAQSERGTHLLSCGMQQWHRGETNLPGTPPRLLAGGAPSKNTRSQVSASGAWKDASTFAMLWRYHETPHHDQVECRFEGDRIQITFTSSIAKLRSTKDSRPVLTGKISA